MNNAGLNKKTIQSMHRNGNCWNNAVTDFFSKQLKMHGKNRFEYTFYNQLHGSISDYIY